MEGNPRGGSGKYFYSLCLCHQGHRKQCCECNRNPESCRVVIDEVQDDDREDRKKGCNNCS
jgi:hypothetical protein